MHPGSLQGDVECDHAGFDLVRISGDFNGRPFERDSDELVVEARRR